MNKKLISDYEAEKIVEKALDMGEAMLKTGAEITRVEDSIRRICLAYTDGIVDVFSIVSLIIVSLHTTDERNITQTRRIYSYSTDLDKLEQLNALSRYICENLPSVEVIEERIAKIFVEKKGFPKKSFVGSIIAASSFAVFFGGTIRDGLAAAFVAALLCIYEVFFKERSNNKIIYTFLCSLFVGLISILSILIGFGMNVDKIMIGNIMLLIPGISFMNSVKDMLCGDIMTGMLRLIESILIAVSIATGFAVALLTLGRLI